MVSELDLRFSRWWRCWCQSFGLQRSSGDGDSMFLRNVGIYVYTALQPRRPTSKCWANVNCPGRWCGATLNFWVIISESMAISYWVPSEVPDTERSAGIHPFNRFLAVTKSKTSSLSFNPIVRSHNFATYIPPEKNSTVSLNLRLGSPSDLYITNIQFCMHSLVPYMCYMTDPSQVPWWNCPNNRLLCEIRWMRLALSNRSAWVANFLPCYLIKT
jgi:hypothetical protein